MMLTNDIKLYRARWEAVDALQNEEQRSLTIEQRWQLLNSVYQMAQSLGLHQSDPSELEVWMRWAKLKAKVDNYPPKA